MKRIVLLAVFVVGLGLVATGVSAQDVVKVAPNNCKVLIDNDQVRVVEVTIKPGEKLAMHSHPAHVVYELTTGKVRSTTPDGKTVDLDFKAGDASFHEARTHAVENIGTTDSRDVLFEIKAPRKTPKKK